MTRVYTAGSIKNRRATLPSLVQDQDLARSPYWRNDLVWIRSRIGWESSVSRKRITRNKAGTTGGRRVLRRNHRDQSHRQSFSFASAFQSLLMKSMSLHDDPNHGRSQNLFKNQHRRPCQICKADHTKMARRAATNELPRPTHHLARRHTDQENRPLRKPHSSRT